ncbi:MAG: hypothetical protein K9M56_04200 [Victivallales bacterium]|nr:hypothetical protein [Victivallales bacterium]
MSEDNGIGKDVQEEIQDIEDAMSKISKVIVEIKKGDLDKLPDDLSAIISDAKDAVETAVELFADGKEIFTYLVDEGEKIYHEIFG